MNVLYVPCDSAALSVGADEVAEEIAAEAARRGLAVEIRRNGTRGMLWLEPLVEVESRDGRLAYGPVGVEDVASLFDAGFLAGGAHPLGRGPTEKIPYFAAQERLIFARCGRTRPLDLADYLAQGGFKGLDKALAMSPQAIVEEVTRSGLRGRGGAGFPTGIKWKTVHDCDDDEKFVCCNADEGDSGTFADRMIMEGDPFLLIEGMAIAARAVGAATGYVYIRSEYPRAIAVMKQAVALAEAAGRLDRVADGRPFSIEIRVGAGAYICGEETAMLESLEGRRGMVRAKPPLPAHEGLFGRPTVINNVLTLTSVPTILAEGAAFYRGYGMGRSQGTQPFQLAGNIKRGGLVEKAFGVTLKQLIEAFGGGTASGRPARAAQVGGPLGAYLPADGFDIPCDYESFAARNALLGHGGIVLFDQSVDMARMARFAMEFCALESCGKCTPCRIGAVRGVEVVDDILAGRRAEDGIALLRDLCQVMTDGSLCAMGGLTPLPVLSALDHFPEDFHGRKGGQNEEGREGGRSASP